jgi:carbon-monoxide dehydrogenase iron sulfur subunit
MKKALTVDINKCLACRSCELACALAHSESKVLIEAIAESPKPQKRVTVEAAGDFAVPMQCRHCEDAPCMAVCPTAAIHRHSENDPVLIDRDLCIGCKYCLMACPFGVIDITSDGKAVAKCDLCIERTKAGEEPACVSACPTKAIKFTEIAEMLTDRRQKAAQKVLEAEQAKQED